MGRCDDFYRKYDRLRKIGPEALREFCDKDPETQRRIERYIDEILPILKEKVAKSEILNQTNPTKVGEILSEKATLPIFAEPSLEKRELIFDQIVKKAEENVMDGKKPKVTASEVEEFIEFCKKDLRSGESTACPGGQCEMPNPRKRGCIDCQIGFQVFSDRRAKCCPICGGTNLAQLPHDWSENCKVV